MTGKRKLSGFAVSGPRAAGNAPCPALRDFFAPPVPLDGPGAILYNVEYIPYNTINNG